MQLPVIAVSLVGCLSLLENGSFMKMVKKGFMGRIGRLSKSIQHMPNKSQADLCSQQT